MPASWPRTVKLWSRFQNPDEGNDHHEYGPLTVTAFAGGASVKNARAAMAAVTPGARQRRAARGNGLREPIVTSLFVRAAARRRQATRPVMRRIRASVKWSGSFVARFSKWRCSRSQRLDSRRATPERQRGGSRADLPRMASLDHVPRWGAGGH